MQRPPIRGVPRVDRSSFRPAAIREYRPNRVVIALDGGPAGYLVLMDPWFPGWSCAIDGRPAPLYRANYAFRGVAVPAGAREAVFTFAPASYAIGRAITTGSLVLLADLGLLGLARATARRGAAHPPDGGVGAGR